MSIEIHDNSEEIANDIKSALLRGLETCGLVAEGYAKKLAPVDTGNLRNSITHTVDDGEPAAYIGTNVEYAPYVCLGTIHMNECSTVPKTGGERSQGRVQKNFGKFS